MEGCKDGGIKGWKDGGMDECREGPLNVYIYL